MAKPQPKPTRLQKMAAQKNKVLTGPKGSKPQSTTSARSTKPSPKASIPSTTKAKPAAKPAAKPKAPTATKPVRALPPAGGTSGRPVSSRRTAAQNKLQKAAEGTRSNVLRSRGPAAAAPAAPKPPKPSLGNRLGGALWRGVGVALHRATVDAQRAGDVAD